MKRVHFVKNRSRNYRQVQRNLMGEIRRHLPLGRYSSSHARREGADINNFSLFIRLDADILMSHGVADKNYLFMKDPAGGHLLNRFRHVLVPGPWLKRRLLADPRIELGDDRIHCTGWPRMDYLHRLVNSPRQRLRRLWGRGRTKINVLWAPTHDVRKRGAEGMSTSTYPDFDAFTGLLAERYDYNVSLHPRNRARKKPTAHLLAEADVVISDFGTIVYEAWRLGKPVIFPRWILKDRIITYTPGSAEAYIFSQGLGYHPGSIDELVAIIDGGAEIGPDVTAFMDEYLPADTECGPARRAAELLLRLE